MNEPTWIAIVPPLLTIVVVIWSKKVLPSLLLGLLVGSYLLNPSLVGGIQTAIESIINMLSDTDSLQVLVFLYLFSGFIALIKKSGGIKAFSDWLSTYIQSEKGVFYILWGLIPVTFLDCDFRIYGTGSIVRSLGEKNNVSKERLAFMINNTAAPIVELIPIATTFVGFNIANIGQALKVAGVAENHSAYSTLLYAIPFEFYSFVVLAATFLSIYFQWKKPSVEKQEKHTKHTSAGGMTMDMEEVKPEIQPRILNLVFPMIAVVFLSFFFYWYFGREGWDGTISSIISATDPNMAMLVALCISIFLSGLLYFFQKYPLETMTTDMIAGGNDLMRLLAILVVAWALGEVTQELGLSEFIQQQLGNSLPLWSIPVSLFLVASAVTYFIGEGWATASIMMPFAVSLAVTSGVGIPICVAAVITGGTFGDTTSPIAGMANMSSNVFGADHMKYIRYASPYNFVSAGIAAVLFLVAGFFYNQ